MRVFFKTAANGEIHREQSKPFRASVFHSSKWVSVSKGAWIHPQQHRIQFFAFFNKVVLYFFILSDVVMLTYISANMEGKDMPQGVVWMQQQALSLLWEHKRSDYKQRQYSVCLFLTWQYSGVIYKTISHQQKQITICIFMMKMSILTVILE